MRYQHWWTPFSCCSRQFLTIHGRRRNDNFKLTAIDHHVKTCKFTKDFLLSLQSYSFFPTIDKPNRVYYNSATLIDNIFARTVSRSSGNIISDISDHYSQFCIDESSYEKFIPKKVIKRYFSWFSEDDFNTELLRVNWELILSRQRNVNCAFSTYYNKLNKLINKHASVKSVPRRKLKQFSKPWSTKSAYGNQLR